jgi:chromosomal replication initiation ATPase DnaA
MVWETLKRELQKELTESHFTKWVEPTKAVAFDGRVLTVEVPDIYTSDWLTTRIAKQAQSKLAGVIGTDEPIRIKFVVQDLSAHLPAQAGAGVMP